MGAMMEIFDVNPVGLAIIETCCLVGLFAHVLAKVSEIRETTDALMTITKYIKQTPYKFALKVLTTCGAALMLAQDDIGIATIVSALGLGYAADSGGNHLKRVAIK